MNPSDRIKAALARPEAVRSSTQTPTMKPPADVETTLPLLGASDATRVGLASSPASIRTPASDSISKVESARPAAADNKLRRARLTYLVLTALVLVAVSVVLIQLRMNAPNKVSPQPDLQVEVKQEGAGLLSVRWNALSAPVVKAREGRLVIVEANQPPKIVQLQAEELKIGHVYYQSSAERQEIRLEVVDGAGAVVKESVLAVSPGTVPGAAVPSQPAQAGSAAAKTLATKMEPKSDKPSPLATQTPAPAVATQAIPPPGQPAPRTFTPPPQVVQRPVEEARTVVLEPSAPLSSGITAPARVNLPQLGTAPAPPVKSPAPQSPAPQSTATNRPANPGGTVEAALLVKKISPVYPAIARTARIQGTVKFTALVDRAGKVQNLQFVSGPQMLVQAAADAVKKWVYRPMMLDGKPSEVITQIEVKFSLGQ